MELERQENVLVVGHQVGDTRLIDLGFSTHFCPVTGYSPMSVRAARFCFVMNAMRPSLARYSYAYFHNLPQADLPYIKIPLHTVIKLTPKAYGCDEER
jgi:hypothetical protein